MAIDTQQIKQEFDTQDLATENIRYEHLFGTTVQQREVTVLLDVSCQCYSDY